MDTFGFVTLSSKVCECADLLVRTCECVCTNSYTQSILLGIGSCFKIALHLEAHMHLLSFYNLPVTQQNTNLLSTMCSTKHLITEKGPLYPTEVIGGWRVPLDEGINTAKWHSNCPFHYKTSQFPAISRLVELWWTVVHRPPCVPYPSEPPIWDHAQGFGPPAVGGKWSVNHVIAGLQHVCLLTT